MKKLLVLVLLGLCPVAAVRAQEARVVTAFLGEQFYDTRSALESSGVVGVRWAWYARTGHGFEVSLDYAQTRVETGTLSQLLGLNFDDPQTLPEELERLAVDYSYVARGGLVRPYVSAGLGYLRADISLSGRAERFISSLGRTFDANDSALTYGAGAGVLIGEDRLRFRYDLRVIRFAELFNTGNSTTLQTSGGFAWVF